MFRRKKKISPNAIDTLIGAGTEMEGTLKSQAGVRIEGVFKGDIETKGAIVVGVNGIARSNLTAKEVTIAGKVFGDVVARGRLTILSGGQLVGNLSASLLNVQEGGLLSGVSKMDRPEAGKPAAGAGPGTTAPAPQSSSGEKEKQKAKQAG